MLGTIVNVCTICAGTIIGCIVKKGIKQEWQDALMNAMGLAALVLGMNSVVQNLPKSDFPVLFILSIAIGSLVGYMIDIDGRLTDRFAKSENSSKLAQGLSTAIMLFCIGTLSILGPVNSALYGDHTFLFTNATLDFVTSMVLASVYGIGIMAAAAVLLCWQGSIYLLASLVASSVPDAMMVEVSIVGGILILSSGLGILKIKDLKAINMLPSLLVPVLWFGLKYLVL